MSKENGNSVTDTSHLKAIIPLLGYFETSLGAKDETLFGINWPKVW